MALALPSLDSTGPSQGYPPRRAASASSSTARSAISSCCGSLYELTGYFGGDAAVAIGDGDGTCCIIEHGISHNQPVEIYSASKIMTAYVMLRLVDSGLISLHTRAADVLDWWGRGHEVNACSNITVFNLLSQTDGLNQYKEGLGRCNAWTLLGCAVQAYNDGCVGRMPGEIFLYHETAFYILGALAMQVTGLQTYDAVFRRYLANPLGISRKCGFTAPSTVRADPGGGGVCSLDDYAIFLRAAMAGRIVPRELRKKAEAPQTLFLGVKFIEDFSAANFGGKRSAQYGLGQWRECEGSNSCNDTVGVKVSSIGYLGYYPWIWRHANESHWGIMARHQLPPEMARAVSIGLSCLEILPRVAKTMAELVGNGSRRPLHLIETEVSRLAPLSVIALPSSSEAVATTSLNTDSWVMFIDALVAYDQRLRLMLVFWSLAACCGCCCSVAYLVYRDCFGFSRKKSAGYFTVPVEEPDWADEAPEPEEIGKPVIAPRPRGGFFLET